MSAAPAGPGLDEKAFATAVLQGLGAPASASNLQFFYAWMAAEGGHTNGALYNPLNTTQEGYGGSNAVGNVKAYPNMQAGVQATIQTLQNGYYTNVVDALKSGNGAGARNAVIASPWAASHYGGGKGFPAVGSSKGVVLQAGNSDGTYGSAPTSSFDPNAVNTPGANPFGQTDQLDPATLKAMYGWTQAFLDQNPDLKDLFNSALGHGSQNTTGQPWTPNKFAAAFQASNWYQTHSDTARQFLTMKATDPAKYAQTVQQQFQKIHDLSIKMGALTPYAVGMKMAEQSLMAGWGDSQITSALQSYVKINAQGSYQGDAATAAQTLRKYAMDNGVNVSDSWLQGAVSQIEGGNMTLQQAQGNLQNYAASAFPGYKEQLQSGMTMQQIADPFIQSYSKIMGVDPATVNLFTPQIRKAMAGTVDPKTGQAQPQSIWQFEQSVRQDPAWMTTKDANDTLSTLGHKVLQDMGVTW